MNIIKRCWKLTYIYNDKTIKWAYICIVQLFGIGLIIVGALSDNVVSDIETDNTKPLMDLVLFDSFAAGRLAIDLSILNIVIGTIIFVVAVVGILGKYRGIKKLLLGVSIQSNIHEYTFKLLKNNNYINIWYNFQS